MNCPFCADTRHQTVLALVMHIHHCHYEQLPNVRLVAADTVPVIRLPVVPATVDMDSIYAKRPDLVKPRGAA